MIVYGFLLKLEIVWENYFGYSNLNESILVDEDSMFILSSISKTITATALLQLYEDGLINLDDNIQFYKPKSFIFIQNIHLRINLLITDVRI